MGAEYLHITYPEKVYSQKNLLFCELYLLNTIRRFKEYKRLREEELMLKILFKSKLSEAVELVRMLDRILPKAKIKEEEKIETPIKEKPKIEVLSLEQEIDAIRNKLLKLQSQMNEEQTE